MTDQTDIDTVAGAGKPVPPPDTRLPQATVEHHRRPDQGATGAWRQIVMNAANSHAPA